MKILVATDGSKHSLEAVKKSCQFISGPTEKEFRIISIVEPVMPIAMEPFAGPYSYLAEAEASAEAIAENAVSRAEEIVRAAFQDSAKKILTNVIVGNPKEAIVHDAKKFGADLIVLGSHGYGFLDRILLGSVSNAVLNHAHCSVLIVRMEQPEDEVQ